MVSSRLPALEMTHTPFSDLIPPSHILRIPQNLPLIAVEELTPFTPGCEISTLGLRIVRAHLC